MSETINSNRKSFLTTVILSLLLGYLGIDRFYLGKVGTGIVKLVTFGGFGVWYIIDLILILTGSMKDKAGHSLEGRDKHLKTALIIVGVVILLGIILQATGAGKMPTTVTPAAQEAGNVSQETVTSKPEVKEETPKEKAMNAVLGLINEKTAFDAGSYAAGTIPAGVYAFIPVSDGSHYYSEDDATGNIIDNANFDTFGWVNVHGVGNLSANGVLVKESDFPKLGVTSAKELYTILNDKPADFNQAGYYKVGVDIPAGKYTFTSIGSAYVSVESGPVGNSEIVDNENFNGTYGMSVTNGQYLSVSRATFVKN